MLGQAPSAEDIERVARATMARLPAAFLEHLDGVVLLVEEWPDEEALAAVGIDDPIELTGLYHGRPIGEKSSLDSGALPDRIHLYRQPILAEWCEGGERLDTLIAHIVIHEIGHHFALSDDDMHALEEAAD